MIIGLQLLSIGFSLLLIYFALIHYKKQELLKSEFLLWLIIWTGVILITIFPNFLRTYSYELFFTRLFDLLVVGGFIFLISIVSIIYVKLKNIEDRLTKLVRKDAIKNASGK